jgi:hypothetical protein
VSFLDAWLEIHLESPVPVAIRPSKVCAHFRTTNGLPVRMNLKYASLSFSPSSGSTSRIVSMPASFSFRSPAPFTNGFGSRLLMTTRDMRAIYQRIRITVADDNAGYARLDDAIHTRWSFAKMAAWFQIYVELGALGVNAGPVKRVDLCMGTAESAMEAFTDDSSLLDYYSTHHGIWRSITLGFACKSDGALHVLKFFI